MNLDKAAAELGIASTSLEFSKTDKRVATILARIVAAKTALKNRDDVTACVELKDMPADLARVTGVSAKARDFVG